MTSGHFLKKWLVRSSVLYYWYRIRRRRRRVHRRDDVLVRVGSRRRSRISVRRDQSAQSSIGGRFDQRSGVLVDEFVLRTRFSSGHSQRRYVRRSNLHRTIIRLYGLFRVLFTGDRSEERGRRGRANVGR